MALTVFRNSVLRAIVWCLLRPPESLSAGLISVSLALSFPTVVAVAGFALELFLLLAAVLPENIPVRYRFLWFRCVC